MSERAVNTSTTTPDQRIEAFKACMAEAGHPVTNVERHNDGRDWLSWNSVAPDAGEDRGYWVAVYRAAVLIGLYVESTSKWCVDHFADQRVNHPYVEIPDCCPCHSGTSGYLDGE